MKIVRFRYWKTRTQGIYQSDGGATLTKMERDDKMKECLLCKVKGIRQPVIKTDIKIAYLIPLDKGGKKVQRNMFSACKYHKKMYNSWMDDNERMIAFRVIKDHLKNVYDDWSIKDCFKGGEDDNE